MNSLPKQLVPGYSFARQKQLQQDQKAAAEAAAHQLNINMLEGGQEDAKKDGKVRSESKMTDFVYKMAPLGPQEYAEKAKRMILRDTNVGNFFGEEGLKYSFGSLTEHLVRLGFDDINKVWKIYIKRENSTTNPSILGFLVSEIDTVVDYMENMLQEIATGFANKKPYLKPETMVGWTLQQPMNNLAFWQHEDCFYTESGFSRLRLMWQCGNVYFLHMNQVHEAGVQFPNYHGPKIRLSRPEIVDFLAVIKQIEEKVGSFKKLN